MSNLCLVVINTFHFPFLNFCFFPKWQPIDIFKIGPRTTPSMDGWSTGEYPGYHFWKHCFCYHFTTMKYPLSWNMSDKSGKTRMGTSIYTIYIYLLEMETRMNPSNIFNYVICCGLFPIFPSIFSNLSKDFMGVSSVFSGHFFSKDGYYHLPGRSALALQVYRMVLPCFGTSAEDRGPIEDCPVSIFGHRVIPKWWKIMENHPV